MYMKRSKEMNKFDELLTEVGLSYDDLTDYPELEKISYDLQALEILLPKFIVKPDYFENRKYDGALFIAGAMDSELKGYFNMGDYYIYYTSKGFRNQHPALENNVDFVKNLIKEHKLDFKRYEDLIDDLTAYEYLQDIVHQYRDIDGKFAFMVESGSHNDDYGIAYIRRNMAELIKKIQVRRGYSTGYGY